MGHRTRPKLGKNGPRGNIHFIYRFMVFNNDNVLHSNLYVPQREVIIVAKTSNSETRNMTGWH